MRSTLEPRATDPNVIMLWAAAVLCFFRSGEISVPNPEGFSPKIHLAWGDVAVDSTQSPRLLKIRSKTDQLGQGVDMYVVPPLPSDSGDGLHGSVRNWRGFFQFANGAPLTKARFTDRVRAVLQEAGLPYNHFAGHSFRIGVATAGLEDSAIRTLGRWNSSVIHHGSSLPPSLDVS